MQQNHPTSTLRSSGFRSAANRLLRTLGCFAVLFALTGVCAHAASCLRGVNIAGAEFGGPEAKYGEGYVYPSDSTLDWAAARSMTAIRLPFRWERLQPELFGEFDPAELARLQVTVQAATSRGLRVVLDLHNYAEYGGDRIGNGVVGADAFGDFWRRLTPYFAANDRVVLGLMNEPADITAQTWFAAAQAGLNAIRDAGSDQLVLVPGTIWTGASHWFDQQEGGSNAEHAVTIRDPEDNFAFEVHQYLDEDYSGTHDSCPRAGDAIDALKQVAAWMKEHGYRGFVGEFGGTGSPDCLQGLEDMARYLNGDSETWIGWTAWAAGDWWGNYPLSLQPADGQERPQMEVLAPFMDVDSTPAQCE